MVTLTIDNKRVTVPEGTVTLEAARELGIEIPHFCYYPKLSIQGSCRLCLVEVGKRLVTSCSTPVTEGMEVRTDTAKVKEGRRDILALYLINHPLDCPICDRGGECPLQDYTYRYGPAESMFREDKWHFEKPVDLSRHIVLDRERCVLCTRCVRFSDEIALHHQIGVYHRGRASIIDAHLGIEFNSNFSGNTIELCPVGALTSRHYRFKARPWDLKRHASICPTCSCGCNIWLDTRIGRVERLLARENLDVDDGWLCDIGRFNYEFLNSEKRLKGPMVRKNGRLVPVAWKEAIDFTAEALRDIVSRYGPDAVAGLASPTATNEDNYSFQRFFRAAAGTNNIDHRVDGSAVVELCIGDAYKKGLKRFTIKGIEDADLIILVGCDPGLDQPIIDLRIKKAVAKFDSKLIVAHYEEVELTALAKESITYRKGSEGEFLKGLVQAIDKGIKKGKKILFMFGNQLLKLEGFKLLLKALYNLKGKEVTIAGLTSYANSTGASEMGILPAYLPGYRAVGDREARKALASLWGRDLPDKVGLDFDGIIDAIEKGEIKALCVMTSQPFFLLENCLKRVVENLELLILQDNTFTEIAELANVVLPQMAFSEVNGTFTNIEGRIQRLCRASRPPKGALEGWRITGMLSKSMGLDPGFKSIDDVIEEIKRAVPIYFRAGYPDVGDKGVLV